MLENVTPAGAGSLFESPTSGIAWASHLRIEMHVALIHYPDIVSRGMLFIAFGQGTENQGSIKVIRIGGGTPG